MKFKNAVEENGIVSKNKTYCFLSDAELRRYGNNLLEEKNFIETGELQYVVTPGEYTIKVNGKPFEIKIEKLEYKNDVGYGVIMSVNGKPYVVEKIRPINRYDIMRKLISVINEIEG